MFHFSKRVIEKKIRNNIITITVLFIFLSFFANLLLPYLILRTKETIGIFGDQFGAVNALFSGLAFAGLIYTIILQRHDLRNQRKELFLQRKELKRNREEMVAQNKTFSLQRFENTFFNMMELQQQIVNNLEITIPRSYQIRNNFQVHDKESITYKGREVFAFLYKVLKSNLRDSGLEGFSNSKTRSILDHYFRHFYTILRYIDQTEAFADSQGTSHPSKEKYQYAKILRATLSRYELVLLYYNGLSSLGNDNLKPLLEKYSMLNNLNEEFLTLTKDVLFYYKLSERDLLVKFLKENDMPTNDYYFLLTEEDNNKNKYKLTAFYHSENELQNGRKALLQFNSVLATFHVQN